MNIEDAKKLILFRADEYDKIRESITPISKWERHCIKSCMVSAEELRHVACCIDQIVDLKDYMKSQHVNMTKENYFGIK